LSSASDRLSCFVVERMFRYNLSLLEALNACRTPYIVSGVQGYTFPQDERNVILGNVLRMKKFAAMGSAVTFPIQSIAYCNMAIAAVLWSEGLKPTIRNIRLAGGKVRVFGDDIILPSSSAHHLAFILDLLQLKVNREKSHVQGYFRESCGMDAYWGTDVTPVYLTNLQPGKTASSVSSWVDVSNNAHSKGLWSLARYMLDQMPDALLRRVPISQTQQAGLCLYTFSNHGLGYEKKDYVPIKWHKSLHRWLIPQIEVRSRRRLERRDSWQSLYQYFVESPSVDQKWSSGVTASSRTTLKSSWLAPN